RPPGDALRAHRGGHARATAVPGIRTDDQRRTERLPPGRGADDDARPDRQPHQEGRELPLRRAVRPRRAPYLAAGPQGGPDPAAPREDPLLVEEEARSVEDRQREEV